MLGRKTLGVAGAAIVGSAALLATNTASAVINIDTGAGVMVAKETLLDSAVTTPSGTTTKYYDLAESSTGGEYDLMVKQGVGFGSGTIYLRIELMNMVFNSDTGTITPTNANTDGSALALVSGGTEGDNSVVISIAGDPQATGNDVLTIPAESISVLPDAAGSVKATWHRESLDAALGTSAMRTVMADDVVKVVDGLEEKGTSSGSMSDVASGFSMFVAGDDNSATDAQIGYVRIRAADNVMHRAATAVRGPGSFVAEATDAVTVTFKGDFANHTFTVRPMMDCTGTVTSTATLNKDKNELAVSLENAAGTAADDTEDEEATPQTKKVVMLALCMEVAEDNTKPIPNTAYTAAVKYTKLANAMFPRADQTVTVGSIGRTGTTVQIPYLTTYEGYNQRLVLSNRGSAEAEYMIKFRPEAGVMATAGDAAEGMLPPGSTTILKATDVVELTGGSRTAATVTVVADSSMIDVSSVIVNRESRDTDTVVHHSGM